MKLHLPSSLRKALLLSLGILTAAATSARAEIMHNSATLLTYTDFASNMGRYSIYQQNELLEHLKEDGVYISFTQGEKPYLLENGVISFESAVDGGPFTAIGYNVTATVQHNGVTNPVFTGRFIGSDQSVHYAGIEYRSCKNNNFLLTPKTDYKITRLSKVITDITPSTLFDTEAYVKAGGQVKGMLQYHMGGGYQQRADENGKTTWLREAYVYVTAGIVEITGFSRETEYDVTTGVGPQDVRGIYDDSYTIGMTGVMGGNQWGPNTAGTPSHPLPYVTQGGDSGSPVWVWNENNKAYELISCHQARGGNNSYSRGASEWTKDTLEHFNNYVDMSKEGSSNEVHISAVKNQDKNTISDIANGSQEVSTTPWHGEVLLSNGEKIDFIGVQSGVNTWNNLFDLKDGDKTDASGKIVNWYAYGNEYLNSTYNEDGQLEYADLFMTENLNFQSTGTSNRIVLDDNVDLGIGYAQFSAKDGATEVSYTITGNGNDKLQFNHAGYIIDEGVSVHIQLVNDEQTEDGTDYYREWRKVGEGDLYLEGSGDNHIFLNVGGKGTTYLDEKNGGYAAYNVLINNGATVNLGGNVEQVKRDVTFGYGGGTLDFAGDVNMVWNNTNNADADGFTIHALTQDAIITNTTGTTTLTYTEDGNTDFLGSFQDGDGKGVLKVVYNANGVWTLNSIHTNLQNASSGLSVENGKVVLAGANTEHAQGSLTGYNQQRYSNADDWHYADAAMTVTVNGGSTFELGSHARLRGTVTVNGDGIFQMDEGVRHQKEYIEGWYELEDTYKIASYYGLYGDVNLQDTNSMMKVQFSVATDANTTVTGKISGKGGMTVDAASGSLTLSGANTFEGTKTVTNGLLILDKKEAAGNTDTHKWQLDAKARLAVRNTTAEDALELVDKSSSGVLVLTADETGPAINLDGFKKLIIGAAADKKIQFGEEKTTETYEDVDNIWNLGGGGGELAVNYRLNNDLGRLVLGNEYTTGSVTLTNTGNKIHEIEFAGKVTLAYTDPLALGGAAINLSYTNRIMGADGTIGLINAESDGVMLLDNMENQEINLSEHSTLHLGSSGEVVYTGNISLDKDADTYYFGGITGTLVLDKALIDQNDGWTNLVLDGQTYSGGVLELRHALQITGSVEVYGHSPYSSEGWTGGNATLRLCEDNSMENPYLVTLYEGGILDINGTEQSFTSISAWEGSKIIDSKGNGVLHINSEGDGFSFLELAGEVEVGTINIYSAKTLGETTPFAVSLGGKMTYDTLNVSGSSGVTIVEGDVLCATGKTVLDSTVLYLGANNATSQLELSDSCVHIGEDGATGTGELAGSISTLTGTQDNVLNFIPTEHGYVGKVSSVVDVAKDSTLTVKGDTARFGSASFAESGGTVVMQAAQVNLENSTGTHFGGTLDIQGKNGKMTLYGNGGSDNILREIDKLNVQKGTTLTLQEQSRNTIWNIHELTGEGNVTWNSQTTHWYSSRVLLGAAANSDEGSTFEPDEKMGTYSGVFTAQRNINNPDEARTYASYVELAHDTIMQRAEVNLLGAGGNGYMTLAVNTENGTIKGLKGNAYAALYAGAAVEGGDQKDSQLAKPPVSTREANLIIAGDEAYDFKGNVYGGENGTHHGLNIVMDGTGTQTFSGAEVTVNSVTAKQGELVLSAASLAIKDRASIYRGATLGTGDKEFTLGHNMTLMVAGSGEDLAKLTSTLKLDGGSIGFDGTTINTSGYALSVQGVNGQKELDIIFESTASLQQDTEYKLASGSEWVGITYHSNNLEYYDAAFYAQNEGLTVTFSLKKDNNIWLGSNDKTTWDDNNFGLSKDVPGEGKTAVFNDLAESQDVQVHGERKSEKLLFDSTKEYTLEGKEAGASLAANSLLQIGSGTTKLGSGVHINGTADVQSGTLVLQDGSHANSAAVAKGATLQLESAAAFEGTVAGEGDVKVAWQGEQQGTLGTAETGIGSLTVESGKLNAADTLNVQRSASVLAGATLQSSTGNILAQEGQPLQLAGTLVIDTSNSNMELKTDVTDHNGTLGSVEKTGANTLTVKSSLVADTLAVKQGRVEIKDSGILMEFLDKTQNLEAVNGGYALLGGDAFTLESDEYTTNLLVGGSKSTIELALGQHSTKTFQGELSMTDGGTLKLYDGGVQINGKITLGVGESDRVTLWGNWGEANSASKAGIILAGEVCGSGTVVLDKGGNAKNQCVTLINDGNTFDGTYEVNDKTSLVVGADSAIRDASVNMKGGSLVVRADASTKSLVSDSGKGLIQIEEGKSLGLQNTNYSGQIKFAEDVTVTANVSGTVAQLTGDVTLESTEAGKAAITGAENTSLANACINLSAGTSLKINKVTMAGQAAITGADGSRVENSLIDLAAGTRLEMANVTLSSDSNVTDGATLVANNLVVEALQPLTFGDSQTKQVEEPAVIASLTLSNIKDVIIEGAEDKGMLVHLVGDYTLGNVDWLKVGLGEGAKFDGGLAVTLLYENEAGQKLTVRGQYTMAEVEEQAAVEAAALNNHDYVYFRLSGTVPEPATSTLSLLALAALAARRRRK